MSKTANLTQGSILRLLLGFTLPVLGALILQTMYGAVDLMIVGRFASSAEMSAVSTGAQLMQTITTVVSSLSMGVTVLIGQKTGQGENDTIGKIIGSSIILFGCAGMVIAVFVPLCAPALCRMMQVPAQAMEPMVQYVIICAVGTLFVVAYNVLGSCFRGIGDSRTPLLAVSIACVTNITLDLLFVGVLGMGAAGAALATVLAQGVSVILCLMMIRRRTDLPFVFSVQDIRPHKKLMLATLKIGAPVALQEFLVSISFLTVTAIVNRMGVAASAGVGVAEKLSVFIMLVPSAFMQSLSAFVAQNIGAGQPQRARKATFLGMACSFVFCVVMAWTAYFHGDLLASFFAREAEVIAASWDYLRGYAVDTLLVSFLFCSMGYFNGRGDTLFVMIQGLIGAFCVRIPVASAMASMEGASLFHIALSTPCSTAVQILLAIGYVLLTSKRRCSDV